MSPPDQSPTSFAASPPNSLASAPEESTSTLRYSQSG
ncbi:hypothetical protein LINPERPRIM_LOCUS11088 [Linum perenne]